MRSFRNALLDCTHLWFSSLWLIEVIKPLEGGWGDVIVNTVLIWEAWRPEFNSKHLHIRLGMVVHASRAELGRQRQGGCW